MSTIKLENVMPVALNITINPPAPLVPPRKRWTRDECAALESSGIWDRERLELIDGELISKMPKHRPHIMALVRMMRWLVETFGWDRVNPEAPIDVSQRDNPTNEPEPDAIVFRFPADALQTPAPQPDDLALVVEISDSTLRFDLTVKAALYARAGIVEYWAVDLNGRRIIVHREPGLSGYGSVVAYSESEKLSPLASPGHELKVGEIFGSLS